MWECARKQFRRALETNTLYQLGHFMLLNNAFSIPPPHTPSIGIGRERESAYVIRLCVRRTHVIVHLGVRAVAGARRVIRKAIRDDVPG